MGRWKNKMEQLKFAVYCFKKSKNARFIKRVKALEEENNVVSLESYGDKTTDIYYLIDMKEIKTGFFAVHNKMLTLLYFADKYGLKPVIRYDESFPYAENHSVNGTDNPFEYYFKQPSDVTPEALCGNKCVLVSRKENSNLANQLNEDGNGYSRSEQFLKELAGVSGKYIRLNETVEKQLNEEIIVPKNEKTLGVHVRGTDFKKNYNGHPVQIKVEDYLQTAIEVFDKGKYEKVFLATDDLEAIFRFKNQFGDKLLVYEGVVRSDGDDTVMNSKSTRENHHYLLGLEVLRDMYSLATCDGLIAGLSQVSYAARIQKMSEEKEYSDLVILDKGINYHKKENCPA